MKQPFVITIAILASIIVFSSCQKTEKVETPKSVDTIAEETFRNGLSNADSLQVIQLADSLMSLFKAGEMDAAIATLKEIDGNGNLVALSAARNKSIRRQFSLFPVYDYSISSLQFNTAEQNIVTFQITVEEPQPGKAPARSSYALSPVKVDGQWYLTIRQSSTGDGHNTNAIQQNQ